MALRELSFKVSYEELPGTERNSENGSNLPPNNGIIRLMEGELETAEGISEEEKLKKLCEALGYAVISRSEYEELIRLKTDYEGFEQKRHIDYTGLVRLTEAAERYNVNPSTIYRAHQKGLLDIEKRIEPVLHPQSVSYVREAQLEQYFRNRKLGRPKKATD